MKKKKSKILKNIEVEDGDIFIKIHPEDSLEAKKELLEITGAVIEIQMAAEKFKQKRREEEARRVEAKRSMKGAHQALSAMLSELPKDVKVRIRKEHEPRPSPIETKAEPVKIVKAVQKEEIKPTKLSDLQKELQNIKSKIGNL
jgi:hypothetical protein